MKLDDKNVSALTLPAGKTELVVFDQAEGGPRGSRDYVPGFCVRLRKSGSRTWYYKYRHTSGDRSADRWVKIGLTTAISGAVARETAKGYYHKVQLGQDPAADKVEAKRKTVEVRIGERVDEYLAIKQAKLRPGSYANVKRHLQFYAKAIHGMTFAALEANPSVLEAAFEEVSKRSGEASANRMAGSLSTFFAWAIKKRFAKNNPTAILDKYAEHPRTRVLSDEELRLIWECLPSDVGEDGKPVSDDFRDIMRLLVLTGQRKGEIAGLRWSEMPRVGNHAFTAIELPGERTKNHRPHRVPLSEPAQKIIANRERWAGRDLVFGTGTVGFGNWDQAKKRLDAAIAEKAGAPLKPWVIHDIRRTVATRMQRLKVVPHVIEMVLNHYSGFKAGIGGVYQTDTYEPEKAAALKKWARCLMMIVGESTDNVVAMPKARPMVIVGG